MNISVRITLEGLGIRSYFICWFMCFSRGVVSSFFVAKVGEVRERDRQTDRQREVRWRGGEKERAKIENDQI